MKVQTNYCNNNLLVLDVKQLNKVIKLYYLHTLKALWDGQGKIKIFENFEIALVLLGQFQNFQKHTRLIYPKSPSQACDY